MAKDDKIAEFNIPVEDDSPRGARLVPALVLFTAFAAFFVLAWYAYTSGQRSMGDSQLAVIEADPTPIKEKPADPGGMVVPNQDKMIFDTISGNGAKPVQEQVSPTPEQPMEKAEGTPSETDAWINERLKQEPAPATPELVEAIKPELPPQQAVAPLETQVVSEAKVETVPEASTPEPAPVALKPAPVKSPAEKLAQKPPIKVEKPVEPVKVEPKPQAAKPAAASGSGTVQLGAYKSEAEAKAAWNGMVKKYAGLSSKKPTIQQADVPGKGIFYRLRVSGVDAKAVCAAVSPCMPVK